MTSLGWMARIACAPYRDFTGLPVTKQLEVCAGCLVTAECLDHALATCTLGTVVRDGAVYGGRTPAELHRLMKARARAVVTVAAAPAAALRVHSRMGDDGLAALIEDVEDLLAARQTPAAIAARLGRAPGGLGKTLARAGRQDLANLFEAEYKRVTVVCDTDARRAGSV